MADGSYELACARFRDSDRLDPAVGTRFNLADCEEKRGRVATAWSLFRGVFAELAVDDDRRPIAAQRAKALEPRLPFVTLLRATSAAPDMRLRVDGTELGEGSFGVALPMDPGPHELVVTSAQRPEQKRSFALAEGERRELTIGAETKSKTSEPAPIAAPAIVDEDEEETLAPEPPHDGSRQRTWGYVVGGAGVAGVVLGGVAGIITLSKKHTADENCDDLKHVCNRVGRDANESGRVFGALSGIGFGVGAVGLVAGAYLLLTAPSPAHSSLPAAAKLAVNPELSYTNGTGFLSLEGCF